MPAELKVTGDMKAAICETLKEIPVLPRVCELFDVDPTTISRHREKDRDFDEAVKSAMEVGYGALEAEAIRRAKDGVVKPVFYRGIAVDSIREYSDTLLLALLKAYKPKKFNPGVKLDLEDGGGAKVSMVFNIKGEDDD